VGKFAVIALAFIGVLIASAQNVGTTPRRSSALKSPECAQRAICFSGAVFAGEEFRKSINSELEFVLAPGWTITVVPKKPEGDCQEFASVVNAPYRAHRELYIDASYEWTSEDEVSESPREFRFVTNCADERTESDRLNIVLWPYTAATPRDYDEALAKLGTSPLGKGRLWITNSRISHSGGLPHDKGRIDWMEFTVEVILPQR
jgi:hypothetical protein